MDLKLLTIASHPYFNNVYINTNSYMWILVKLLIFGSMHTYLTIFLNFSIKGSFTIIVSKSHRHGNELY